MLQYQKGISVRCPDIDVQLVDHFDRGALDGVRILHLFGLSDGYKPLVATLRASRPDIRVVISPTYYLVDRRLRPAALLGRWLPIPNYFSVKRDLLAMADRIVVNSRSEAQQLSVLFGRSLHERTSVLPNAVEDDFTDFRTPGAESAFLQYAGVQPGYFLSVGFLDDRKNSLAMIEAHLATYATTGRALVLIGGNRYADRTRFKRLETLVAANPGRIVHLPFVDRGSDLMRSAYLNCGGHVLVSHLETPGLANLEACRFGKPLLVGDCPPVREYFGGGAVYAEPRSDAAIRRGFVALDRRIRAGGTESRPERFRLSRVVDELAGLYRSVGG